MNIYLKYKSILLLGFLVFLHQRHYVQKGETLDFTQPGELKCAVWEESLITSFAQDFIVHHPSF